MQLNYTLRYNEEAPGEHTRPHTHGGFEVALSLSDGVYFYIDRTVVSLRPGTLLFTQDALWFRIVVEGLSYKRYLLNFTESTLEQISTPETDFSSHFKGFNGYIQLSDQNFAAARRLFHSSMHREVPGFGADVRRDIAYLELMLFLCEQLHGGMPFSPPPSKVHGRLTPILEYILANLHEPLTLNSLCSQFYMSKSYLCDMFKSATGFTVNDYIIRHRILKACNLLREGTSVQAASEQCGFDSYAHFIRTFSRIIGMSPGRYARKHVEDNSG